jgi:peptide/nickel transport system permease protein
LQQYILRRLILTIPVVWAVTLVLFILLRLTPGDPVQIEFGIEGTPEMLEAEHERLGLNRPIVVQYLDWAGRMLRGDFGKSLRSGRPVADEIWLRLPATLELQLLALILTLAIAIPLGTIAAVKNRSPVATATSAVTMVSIAVPGFFVSTMLVFLFTYKFRVFETPRYVPITEDLAANLGNVVLPVLALSYGGVAVLTRFVRSSVQEVLAQDYIRTARAKGLTQWTVVVRHALRNALLPIITLLGLSLGALWTGSFITERIFNWPGVGRLATSALLNKDYPMVQGVVFLLTMSYVLANLMVDVAYAFVDPRINYDRRR